MQIDLSNATPEQLDQLRSLSTADMRHANERALFLRLEAAAVADRKRLDEARAARIAAANAAPPPPLMASRSRVSDITGGVYIKR